MAREHVVYTQRYYVDASTRFFRDISRSIAFGGLMFLSFVFLLGPLLVTSGAGSSGPPGLESSDGIGLGNVVCFFLLGLPLCVFCWWAALEVADDRHWELDYPIWTLWDEQRARRIIGAVKHARYLESQGEKIDTSIVLSDDIYAAAHKLIDETDEATIKVILSALLASTDKPISRSVQYSNPRLLPKSPDLDRETGQARSISENNRHGDEDSNSTDET